MTKTRAWLLIGIVLIASAYMAGFWPERQRAREARDEVTLLQGRIAELEARGRLAEILGLLLRLSDSVVARNYGDASDQATAYFDRVSGEISASTQADVQTVLQSIHQSRDRVVAALARTEPMIIETLREQEHALRRALSYPVPDRIPSTPAPDPEPAALPAPGDTPAP
ncbi:MAG: hypothetical protein AB7F99_03970 [Vicinamibacterales bacterium]